MNLKEEFNNLTNQIKNEKNIKIKQKLTLKQIEILKNVQEEFILKAKQKGYSLESYNVLAIIQDQYKSMKYLAEQVNLSTEKYEQELDKISVKLFGHSIK